MPIRECRFILFCLLVIPCLTYADETEIYFNSKQEKIKPNVLFILDRSASMDADASGRAVVNNPTQDLKTISKMNLMKEAFQLIFNKDELGGYRVGVMDYGSGYPNLRQEITDIDEVDPSRNIDKLNPVYSGDKTTFSQPVWLSTDDGYQNGITQNNWLDFTYGDLDAAKPLRYFAYRFDNILLKSKDTSGAAGPDYGIESAKLSLYIYTPALSATYYDKKLNIYIDPDLDSQYLRPRTKNDLSSRYNAAVKAGSKYKVECPITSAYLLGRVECDVTDLVRMQIGRDGWKDGNAITFIILNGATYKPTNASTYMGYLSFKEYPPAGSRQAYLNITAKNNAIAENRRTKKETLVDRVFSITSLGATETNNAILLAAQYVSNIPNRYSVVDQGPYHSNGYAKYLTGDRKTVTTASGGVESPLVAGCQLTHFIVMSDGQPTASYEAYIKNYIGYKGLGAGCNIDGQKVDTRTATENCGRALVKWLATNDQSSLEGANFIRTHTIGFGMVDDNADPDKGSVQFGPDSAPVKYLQDLASYGEGQFHTTTKIEGLVEAFKSIINEALSVDTTAVSGQVITSASSSLDQRREVFYSLYKSGIKDYWDGNLKGFKMHYLPVTVNDIDIEIPVLYSWFDSGATQALDSMGKFKSVDSAWSKDLGDGGNVAAGGVLAQLPNEDELPNRPLFTVVDNKNIAIKSGADLPINLLDLTDKSSTPDTLEKKKNALLDFMRGYTYEPEQGKSTAAAVKKLGDSIASGVSLVSYGCTTGDKLLDCNFDNLNTVGFLASNDGVFRAYDLVTGKLIKEYMPKEMLPIIQKLQNRLTLDERYVDNNGNLVNKTSVKTYGLDGNVVIYHDDKPVRNMQGNIVSAKDGIINNGETAYAYVAAGRGGPYIYAFDISDKNDIKFKWFKTDKDLTSPLLGATWSEPVVGKVNIGGTIVPVIIFGAGYDEQQDDPKRGLAVDSKGNGVYMLNANTGALIWSAQSQYSVPGGVSIVTEQQQDDELITDIFFGDMGGQLWRFHVNNGTGVDNLMTGLGRNGVIASISGNGINDHRRFYQKPIVYDLTEQGKQGILSVNIGSGYKAHPLVTKNEDRFYSFRFPKNPSQAYSTPLTESDLGTLTLNTTGQDNYVYDGKSIDKGFMIKLESGVGEKVLSNPYAIGSNVVFSTYIPDNTFDPKSCVPNSGKQRSYSVNLITGKNLLTSTYIETAISSIPSDVALYCGSSYCSLVTNLAMLNGDKDYFEGRTDCEGEACLPFSFNKGNGIYIKTGWTDLFSM